MYVKWRISLINLLNNLFDPTDDAVTVSVALSHNVQRSPTRRWHKLSSAMHGPTRPSYTRLLAI